MSIVFDGASEDGAYAGASSVTWNHTVTSSINGYLVVSTFCTDSTAGDRPVTGVTFNSDALSNRAEQDGDAFNRSTELWGMIAPDVATGAVVITFTGTVSSGGGGAISYTGVDQTNPTGAKAILAQANDSTPTVAIVSTAPNSMIVSGVAGRQAGAAEVVADSPGSTRWSYLDGTDSFGGTDLLTTTVGSYTLAWTEAGGTNTADWLNVAIELLPSGATIPSLITSSTAYSFDVSITAAGTPVDVTFNAGSGTNTFMIATIAFRDAAGYNVDTVTFNGDALTEFGAAVTPNNAWIKGFYRKSPDAGSATLSFTPITGTGTIAAIISVFVYEHVDQTTPFDGYTTGNGTDDTMEITVTSAVGDTAIYLAAAYENPFVTPTVAATNYIERYDNNVSPVVATGGDGTGAASVAFVGTVSHGAGGGMNGWVTLGLNLNAVVPTLNRGSTWLSAEDAGPTATAVTDGSAASTAGRLIVGIVQWEAVDTTILSVTDDAGSTWVIGTKRFGGSEAGTQAFWTLSSKAHATNDITVTMDDDVSYISVGVQEYYWYDGGTWTLDDEDTNGGTGTAFTTPAITLTGNEQPIIAGVITTTSQSFTLTLPDTIISDPSLGRKIVDQLYNSGAGSLSPNITWTNSQAWAGTFLTFKNSLHFTEAPAGIAFDAASNGGYVAASDTDTWAHTCTGANRYLVVGVGMLSLAQSVASITYAGVAMTLLGVRASLTGAARVELWGMIAPATGANNIVVTLTGSIAWAGVATSFTGVHQTSPVEGFNSDQATNVGAADATVNITSVADNDWIVDIVATDDTAITVGAGQTERNNVTGAGGSAAQSTEGPKTPAGAVTMSWTAVAALATWSIAGIALRPTAAQTLARSNFFLVF